MWQAEHTTTDDPSFDPKHFAMLADLEDKHFWFQSRNKLIVWAINKYFPVAQNFLECGCGTGCVLSNTEQNLPHLSLTGFDLYAEGLNYAAKKTHNVKLTTMDICNTTYKSEFDLIGAFDVIEHIQDDLLALRNMHSMLKPSGGCIITVPQHPHLWSTPDEIAYHKRRYTKTEIKKKLKACGFKIIRITSFISLLYPFMLISRLKSKRSHQNYNVDNELKINRALNYCFAKTCNCENWLIRKGLSFPLGGSLLVVARKI